MLSSGYAAEMYVILIILFISYSEPYAEVSY